MPATPGARCRRAAGARPVISHHDVEASFHSLIGAAESQAQGAELVIALLRESTQLIQKRQSRGGALSDAQVQFLIESGDFSPGEFDEVSASVARGELANAEHRTRLAVVAASLSAAEVADLLGIDQSRVRHRQAKGSLYAFSVAGKRRYPTWQFTVHEMQPVLPGLATVVKAFPADMQPATIQGFMTTPQESLRVDDEAVTPPEWLLHGGDPRNVVAILDSLLQS